MAVEVSEFLRANVAERNFINTYEVYENQGGSFPHYYEKSSKGDWLFWLAALVATDDSEKSRNPGAYKDQVTHFVRACINIVDTHAKEDADTREKLFVYISRYEYGAMKRWTLAMYITEILIETHNATTTSLADSVRKQFPVHLIVKHLQKRGVEISWL